MLAKTEVFLKFEFVLGLELKFLKGGGPQLDFEPTLWSYGTCSFWPPNTRPSGEVI